MRDIKYQVVFFSKAWTGKRGDEEVCLLDNRERTLFDKRVLEFSRPQKLCFLEADCAIRLLRVERGFASEI